MKWNVEQTDLLLALWRDGLSAGAIADHFGRLGVPVTRNAVIGRVHRKMAPDDRRRESPISAISPHRERDMHKRKRGPKPAAIKYNKAGKPKIINTRQAKPSELEHSKREWEALKAQMAARPDVGRITNILDLEPHHCRWPVGDGPFAFCGDRKVPGKSYCAGHLARSQATRALEWLPVVHGTSAVEPTKGVEELHETVAA